MPVNSKELGLGTVFTGKVDSSFSSAVGKLKSILYELGNLQAQIKKVSSGSKGGMTLYQEFSEYAKAQGAAVNEMSRYRQALAQIKEAHGETGAAFQSAKSQLNQVEKAVQATARAMNIAGQDGKDWAKSIDRISLMNGVISGDLKTTAKGFESVTAAGRAQLQTMGIAERETKRFGDTAQKAGRDATFMGGQIGWVTGAMERMGNAIRTVASYSIAGAGFYALMAGIGGATKEIIDFDQSLKGTQAITQATAAEIGVMSQELKGIAKDTKVGPQEAAQAITLLGQAGLEAKESIGAIRPTTTLAIGAMAGMEAAADLLTTTLMSFNMQSVESARVADVMANAMNKSKLDVEKLRIAFSYVGASAAEAGLTLEQTAAAMMVLSNAGLRASTIGTGLRQVLAKLINPNEKLREAYESHKISLEKINPLTVGWGDTLRNLSSVLWNHQKNAVDMGKAYEIFQLRGAQAAAVLVRAYKSGDYKKMLDYTYEIGSANQMAATQMEGLGYKLANLGNQAKLAAIAVGDAGLVGSFKMAIDSLRGFLGGLNQFLSSTAGQVVLQVGAITGVVIGLGKAFQTLGAAVLASQTFVRLGADLQFAAVAGTRLSSVLNILSAGFMGVVRFLTGPVGIVAGLTALGVAAYRAVTANERLIQQTNEQIVKNESVAVSIESYRAALKNLNDRLEAGQDVHLEYDGVLKRLIQDHPQLAKVVDLTKVSYKNFHQELDTALKKMSALQAKIDADTYAKSLSLQTKEMDKLKTVIDAVKQRTAIIPDAAQKISNFEKELSDRSTQMDATIQKWVLSLRELVTSGAMTREEVSALISSATGLSDEGIKLNNVLENKLANALRTVRDQGEEVSAVVSGMPQKFRALFDSLTDLQKFEFLGDYKALKSKIASIRKEFKDAQLGGNVNAAIEQAENQFIEDFKRKVAKIKEVAAQDLRYESILSGLQTDRREKIEQEYTERAAQIRKFYEQQYEIVKNNETRLAELKNQVQTLETENGKKRDYDLAQLDADIAERKIDLAKTVAMQSVEIAKRGAREESDTKNEAHRKEVEITVNALREIAVARKTLYEQTLALFGENDQRTITAHQAYESSILDIEKAITSGTKGEVDQRFRYQNKMEQAHLLERYRMNEISGEEFLQKSRQLQEQGLLDEQEMTRRRIAVQGTMWDQINYGFTRSRGQIEQWGEFWISTSEHVADSLSSNLTDSFIGLIDRTKSAKEAFTDFAKNTVRWLTEILTKQLMMKAIGGLMALFAPSTPGTAVSLSGGSLAPNVAHAGWKVGQSGAGRFRRVDPRVFLGAPRFHSGLNPDEIPAIVQTGERILSRKQNARYEATMGAAVSKSDQQPIINNIHFDKIEIIANDPLSFSQMLKRDPRTFASMFTEGITRGDMGMIRSIREVTG